MIAQWITASLIFFILDIRLISFYGLLGDQNLPWGGSYLITLLAVIVITNSLNLIDGIDGLASVFSLIATLFFGTWFYFIANYQYAILCYALSGGILAFLFQNWEPSKIFMGDTGSLVIGTLLAILAIQFVNQNFKLENLNPYKFNSSIGTAICVLILPLVDTSRIIIIRLYKKISPLTADKRHIHHALVRLNFTHRQAVYILTIVHVSIISIALLMKKTPEWLLLGVIFVIVIALCILLDRFILKALDKETL